MVDASMGKGVVMFGGFTGPPALDYLNELWTYGVVNQAPGWALAPDQQTPSPGDGFACIEQCDHALYVTVSGEVWDLDVATMRWTKKQAPRPLTPLHGNRAAYDSQSHRLITFGGDNFNELPLNETWAYDPVADTWTQMHPKSSPPARFFHAAAYDPVADRVIVYGGLGEGLNVLNDTWAYDYDHDSWTRLATRISPSAREYNAMAYDPIGKRMVMFGGAGENEVTIGDTWTLDVQRRTWTRLKIAGPSARAWYAMAFDRESSKFVLFGGGRIREEYTSEVWLFDPRKNSWSKTGSGAT